MELKSNEKIIENVVIVKMENMVNTNISTQTATCPNVTVETQVISGRNMEISPFCVNSDSEDVIKYLKSRTLTGNNAISLNGGIDDPTAHLINDEGDVIGLTAEHGKLQALVFLEDAIYYRSIHHKVNQFSLKLYRWYHSGPVKCSIIVAMILLLLLAFIEYPSSLSWSSDPRRNYERYKFPDGFTEGIELVCLCILTFSCIAQGYMSINGNKTKCSFIKKNPWLTGGYVVLILSFVDVIVSLFLGNFNYRYRIRRLFRPYFLAQNTTMLKKTLKAMWNTVPEILSVLTLLSLHLYFFTMLGMLIFHSRDVNGTSYDKHDNVFNSTEWGLYFKSFDTALISLVVLMTTANNPDVMMPSYSINRLYAIYFIAFSLVGTFLIFNLLTAIIYNQFRGYFKCSMQTSYFRRCVALSAAYRALLKVNSSMEIEASCSKVPLSLVKDVIDGSRMTLDQKRLVLQALSKVEEENVSAVNFESFNNLFQNIDSKCQSAKSTTQVPSWSSPVLRLVQKIVRSRYFNICGNLVVLLNAILMTVEIAVHFDEAFQDIFSDLNVMNYVFVGYYTLEQVLKILSLGKRYLFDLNCLYDGAITIALLCLEISQLIKFSGSQTANNIYGLKLWDCSRLVNILVLLRLLRVVPNFKPMALVTGVMLEIIRSLKSFAGIIIIIYYVFAILGMIFFQGAMDPTNFNVTAPYECGTYQQLQYWANNFDDFASSLVVLWDVMVVNNWGVFLKAFKDHVSPWSQIYFVAWWLLSAVVCINLFVALILDHFIAKWEGSSDEGSLSSRGTIQSLFRKHLQEPSQERIEEELRKHPFLSGNFDY